ncbi:PAS domain-containing protein [Flavobacteriaceae bacterium M23B6Z8]
MSQVISLQRLSESLSLYFWIQDQNDGSESWSPDIFKIIGYGTSFPHYTLEEFVYSFVHESDQKKMLSAISCYLKDGNDFEFEFRLRKHNYEYHWLLCKSPGEIQEHMFPNTRFVWFRDINEKKKYQIRYEENKFFYQESAEMTGTGGWFVDFVHKKTYWDNGARRILENSKEFMPSIKLGLSYFTDGHRFNVMRRFISCMHGQPFKIEVRMKTTYDREFWAILIGKPIYNEHQKLVGLRGVIQDIDEVKIKELNIRKSMDIIASQNARLYNFAHIVSHNLRSHSSNLELVTELIDDATSPQEKDELFDTVKQISISLNTTIEHLNEVAAIHTQINKKPQPVDLGKALRTVTASINQIIHHEKATIESDFSSFNVIKYIPAYIESILLNLITNSIKYRHPDRDPHIKIKTFKKNDVYGMTLCDNGLGIDLDTYGKNIFGMYKTFHQKSDSVGIGLFITKNQIESLNGQIQVSSEVNKGTCFEILFNSSSS